MNRRYSNRRRSRLLPFLLLAMGALVLVLVATIALTGGKDDAPTVPSSASPSVPSSTPESSESSESSTPESDGESSAAPSSDSEAAPPDSSSSSSSAPPSSSNAASLPSTPVGEQGKYYEKDKPLLVNSTNKVPTGNAPKLESIVDPYKMEARAAVAFKDMLAKAWQDGISLWVVSAYRSNDKQTTNFNSKVKEYENKGYTATEAYNATAKLIAVPGTSEHETGLAVDVNSLYTSFENTKEFKWLIANCASFGFVLRYPKDKVDITEISYEPWHYRYVGSNHAQVIMDKGICLEEYLSGTY